MTVSETDNSAVNKIEQKRHRSQHGMITFEKALDIAEEAFEGLTYGKSDRPMMEHLIGVVDILKEYGYDSPIQLIVGLLHDLEEDTDWTIAQISAAFEYQIAYAIYLCSDGAGFNRKERKANWRVGWETARALSRSPACKDERELWEQILTIAGRAKSADRLYHLRSCIDNGNAGLLAMYRKEHNVFKSTIRPKADDRMWIEIDALIQPTSPALKLPDQEHLSEATQHVIEIAWECVAARNLTKAHLHLRQIIQAETLDVEVASAFVSCLYGMFQALDQNLLKKAVARVIEACTRTGRDPSRVLSKRLLQL